jgi:hypothetical protein
MENMALFLFVGRLLFYVKCFLRLCVAPPLFLCLGFIPCMQTSVPAIYG